MVGTTVVLLTNLVHNYPRRPTEGLVPAGLFLGITFVSRELDRTVKAAS